MAAGFYRIPTGELRDRGTLSRGSPRERKARKDGSRGSALERNDGPDEALGARSVTDV